jgi:hypothetical protein
MALTFWQMLSHFFPGLIVSFSLFLYVDLVSKKDLLVSSFQNAETLVAAMSIFLVAGTILGVIVDSIHHRVVVRIFRWLCGKTDSNIVLYDLHGKKVGDTYFIRLLGVDEFNRVYEAYYYYSEAYINFAIALVPLTIAFSLYATETFSFGCLHIVFLIIGSLLSQLFLYWSGYEAWRKHQAALRDAINGALDFAKIPRPQ